MIHIVGMGIPGCLLAVLLDREGIDFTWEDRECSPDPQGVIPVRTAWKASTGCIYPSGSTKFGPDEACREVWLNWCTSGLFEEAMEPNVLEVANWIFNHKKPPHGGKYEFEQLAPNLRMATRAKSLHLNAQQLVVEVRRKFDARRRAFGTYMRLTNATVIHTHGFTHRLSHVYWGWTRLVGLDYSGIELRKGIRPAFYFREGLLNMSYAYPVPNTPYWYAGSSLIKQQPSAMKELDVEKHYQRWLKNFERMAGGHVKVLSADDTPMQGWRPASKDEDWLQSRGCEIWFRPLWNSGIRHFPMQWSELARLLAIRIPDNEVIPCVTARS